MSLILLQQYTHKMSALKNQKQPPLLRSTWVNFNDFRIFPKDMPQDNMPSHDNIKLAS